MPRIPARIVHRPWYVGALRTGALAPAALPPLVRTAMFPDRPDEPYTPAPGVRVPERVHVQCHARHYGGWRGGELRLLAAGLDPNRRDSLGNRALAGVPDVPDWLRALLR